MSVNVSELPALHTTGTFPEVAVYNHNLRMEAVIQALSTNGIRSIIDLGCGDGAFFKKISSSEVDLDHYLGIDPWEERIEAAKSNFFDYDETVVFSDGNMTDLYSVVDNPRAYRKFGAVVLLETIEHVPLDEVSKIEQGVFDYVKPKLVVVTTPDATQRLNDEQLLARGHHFEWDIDEFQEWAESVTNKYNDYSVDIEQLTGPTFVRNTQVAVFRTNQ